MSVGEVGESWSRSFVVVIIIIICVIEACIAIVDKICGVVAVHSVCGVACIVAAVVVCMCALVRKNLLWCDIRLAVNGTDNRMHRVS